MTVTGEKFNPNPIEKTVYFVRHGQSVANTTPTFQESDSPLSEKGKEQAETIAKRASHLTFEALIASPLARAKQTAEAIQKVSGKVPEYSDLFAECMKPGGVNGKPFTDAAAEGLWRKWQESLYTPGTRIEDGENYADIVARVDAGLEYLKDRPEKSLVVVTHGFFLRTLVARVLLGDFISGDILRRFVTSATTENTGLTVLHYRTGFEEEARWRLWIYNDHAHLG